MLLLLLAALVGGLIAFAILFPYGLLAAILGAVVGGALCIGLAGAWLVYRSRERQADGRRAASPENDAHNPQRRVAR